MRKNMGTADRVVRTLIALAIILLWLTGVIGGLVAVILGIVAVVFLLTSLTAKCPGYGPLGISTRSKRPTPPA